MSCAVQHLTPVDSSLLIQRGGHLGQVSGVGLSCVLEDAEGALVSTDPHFTCPLAVGQNHPVGKSCTVGSNDYSGLVYGDRTDQGVGDHPAMTSSHL